MTQVSQLQEQLCGQLKANLAKPEIDCPIEFQQKELVKQIKLIACVLDNPKKIVILSPAYSMMDDKNFRITQRLVTLGYKLEVI